MLLEVFNQAVCACVRNFLFGETFADGTIDPSDLVVITDPDPVVYVGELADGDGEGRTH